MQEDLRLAFPTQLTRPFTETDGIEKCVVRKEKENLYVKKKAELNEKDQVGLGLSLSVFWRQSSIASRYVFPFCFYIFIS